jgi:hypothetical protein
MAVKTVLFLAIVLTALCLVPAGAHFFELPNKLPLGRDAYFTVQQIYAGWAFFGIPLFGAIFVNLLLVWMLRADRPAFYFAILGFLTIAAMLVLFFIVVFPTNQATANWTEMPENWEALRSRWEYGHAVNAVITFLGLCAVTLAAVTARD